MTSPRDVELKFDKSLVVNMLRFEATSKDSHLPPLPRSVIEEMVHKSESRVRTKPAIRSVPDSVKLYQKMKKRGIFTVGLSADSKVADPSFKIGTKGFNLSNLPESITYTCTKQLRDEVWVEPKREPARKQVKPIDDGFVWPKYTRNNTMILPKLSYGQEQKKKMKPLVPTEDEGPPPDIPEPEAKAVVEEEAVAKEEPPKTLKLISIGQEGQEETPPAQDENKVTNVPKEEASPRPALRQVTIGADLPQQSTEALKKKEIRSLYPMYDTLEEKREHQRHNWWEKRSKTQVPPKAQKPEAALYLAPVQKAYSMAQIPEEKPLRVLTVNKDYVTADEIERRALKNNLDDSYLSQPGVFDKYLQTVKALNGDKLAVTGVNFLKTTHAPPPSAATDAGDLNQQSNGQQDNGLDMNKQVQEPSCSISVGSLDQTSSVPQLSEPNGAQQTVGEKHGPVKLSEPEGAQQTVGEKHGPVKRNSSFLDLPESPRDPHERPPSGTEESPRIESTSEHKTPIRRTTSSFLEPPTSPRDLHERPPSIPSPDPNPQDEVVPAPLSRRATPGILVSTDTIKPEAAEVKEGS